MTQTAELPLRAVRESRGLSLREAARKAQISSTHLSRVERREGSLSVDSLRRLARVLRVDVAWLVNEVGKVDS